MEVNNTNQEHTHKFEPVGGVGTAVGKKCSECGMVMAPTTEMERSALEQEALRRFVIDTVVADVRANGSIRHALLGL